MKKSIEEMDSYELSRWYALIEAVDLIDNTCKNSNKDFDVLHLNPIAIKQYINDISVKYQVDLNENNTEVNKVLIDSVFSKVEEYSNS